MSRSLNVGMAALAAVSATLLWLAYLNASSLAPNECAMTYFDGSLHSLPKAPLHPQYSLQEFKLSSAASSADNVISPLSIAALSTPIREEYVVFVPGNGGHAFQSRSLATRILHLQRDLATSTHTARSLKSSDADIELIRTYLTNGLAPHLSIAAQADGNAGNTTSVARADAADVPRLLPATVTIPSRVHIRVFALHFREELTALSSRKALEQAHYTAQCLQYLTTLAEKNSVGISVVGHSMGGVVALTAASLLDNSTSSMSALENAPSSSLFAPLHTIVTVGAPTAAPVAGVDPDAAALYADALAAVPRRAFLAIAGGERDLQSPPELSLTPAATAAAAAAAAAATTGARLSIFASPGPTLASASASASSQWPAAAAPVDHQCLAWCAQVTAPLAAVLVRRAVLTTATEGGSTGREPLVRSAAAMAVTGAADAVSTTTSAAAAVFPVAAAAAPEAASQSQSLRSVADVVAGAARAMSTAAKTVVLIPELSPATLKSSALLSSDGGKAVGLHAVALGQLPATKTVAMTVVSSVVATGLRLCRTQKTQAAATASDQPLSKVCRVVPTTVASLPAARVPLGIVGWDNTELSPARALTDADNNASGRYADAEAAASTTILVASSADVATTLTALNNHAKVCAGCKDTLELVLPSVSMSLLSRSLTNAESVARILDPQQNSFVALAERFGVTSDKMQHSQHIWALLSEPLNNSIALRGPILRASAASVGIDAVLVRRRRGHRALGSDGLERRVLPEVAASGLAATLRLQGLPVPVSALTALEPVDIAPARNNSDFVRGHS